MAKSEIYQLERCKLLNISVVSGMHGDIAFIESNRDIPFSISRIYYISGVPAGSIRGGHAHKKLHQLIIAISGSFDIILNDGSSQKRIHLSSSSIGLYICPMIWRELKNFSSGAVCMVLASDYYDEEDYYRDFSQFHSDLKLKK